MGTYKNQNQMQMILQQNFSPFKLHLSARGEKIQLFGAFCLKISHFNKKLMKKMK
jgi:hypothetical protein